MSRSLNKEAIRQQHPLYGQERIEVSHSLPRYRGGTDDPDNLSPQTIVDHALIHLHSAGEMTNRRDIEREMGAFRLIMARMTEQELAQLSTHLPQVRQR